MIARLLLIPLGTRCAIITVIDACYPSPHGRRYSKPNGECMHENEGGAIYHCPDCGWKGPKEQIAEEDDWRCPVCGSLFEAEPVEPADD